MNSTTCPISNTLFGKKVASEFVTVDHTVDILTSISEASQSFWDNIVPEGHVFLSYEYLHAFEASVSDNVGFRYLVFRERGHAVGVAAFQIIHFDAGNVAVAEDAEQQSFMRKLIAKVIKPISFRLLVSGNAFMTGEYGLYFKDGALNADRAEWLHHGIDQIVAAEQARGESLSGVLIKDYYLDKTTQLERFKQAGYLEFQVQPNMIVDIDSEWGDFDGYLQAMTSKYRTRVKRAIKDLNGIDVRPLNEATVKQYMDRIESLYDQVIDNSHFKLAKFDIGHLKPMKATLGDTCHIDGFFKGDELIGFISYLIRSNGELVAGMTGFDREEQQQHDIYLNILLQLVRRGIEQKAERVVLGRTAMEIKSSIGAKPHDMVDYVRHCNSLMNAIIKPIIKLFSSTEEWKQRTPFKADR